MPDDETRRPRELIERLSDAADWGEKPPTTRIAGR